MRWMSAIASVMVAGLLFPAAALAHVTVDVADGRYAVELGFEHEPAYLGQPNAVFVKISEYGSGGPTPVDGLAATLDATVEKDGSTLQLPLVPQGEGVYLAPFFPTALGDYTFRLDGEIDGEPVAIEESSSPTTFDPVEPLSSVQFPAPLPDAATMAAAADEASVAATSARTFAVIAVALATLGVALAALGLTRRRA